MELWQQLLMGGLNLVVVGVVLPLARSVARMRANELRHVQESLDRLERKLDAHIEYHLEKGL